MNTTRIATWAAAVALLAGCNKSSGGGLPFAAPGLHLTLEISPGESSSWTGRKITLQGDLRNGGAPYVTELTWTASPAGPTFSDLTGSSAGVTCWTEGTYTITAKALDVEAEATIVVEEGAIPEDPGLVFGTVHAPVTPTGLSAYPADGTAPTNVAFIKRPAGVVADCKGEGVYFMNHHYEAPPGPWRFEISRYDLKTKEVTSVVDIDHATWGGGRACGLKQDKDGNLYTLILGASLVLKIDPTTGEVTNVGGANNGVELAVGTVDGVTSIYTAPLTIGIAPGTWITKVGTGVWMTDPSFWDGKGLACVGLVANDRGEVFAADLITERLFRYIDLNHDGDAADDGESTLIMEGRVYGLSNARGGSVLANVFTSTWGTLSPGDGLYWLVDRNQDGDYADAGENVLYNAIPAFNGETGANVTAWWR